MEWDSKAARIGNLRATRLGCLRELNLSRKVPDDRLCNACVDWRNQLPLRVNVIRRSSQKLVERTEPIRSFSSARPD